jgi:DNA polymerase-3 subunit delta'
MIILISHQANRLLATIRSRCQSFNFNNTDKIVTHNWLKSKTEHDINLLLGLSFQAPLAALDLVESLPKRDELMQSLLKLLRKQEDPIDVAIQWSKLGAEQVIYWLINLNMDVIRNYVTDKYTINHDMYDFIHKIVSRLSVRDVFVLLDKQLENYRLLKNSNVKEQSLLESTAIAWLHITKQV